MYVKKCAVRLVLLVSCLTLLATASLQTTDEFVSHFMSETDANKDAYLSLDELKQNQAFADDTAIQDKLSGYFADSDADGDAMLSTEEAGKMLQILEADDDRDVEPEGLLKATDTDGDGKVSFVELQTQLRSEGEVVSDEMLKAHFAASDSNANSFLEADEVATMMERLDPKALREPDEGGGEDQSNSDRDEHVPLSPADFLKLVDTDVNGKISLEEIQAQAVSDGEHGREAVYKDHFDFADYDSSSFLEGKEVADMLNRLDTEDIEDGGEVGGEVDDPHALFAMLDADRNGNVSLAEVERHVKSASALDKLAHVQDGFSACDKNQDQALDEVEMASFFEGFSGQELTEEEEFADGEGEPDPDNAEVEEQTQEVEQEDSEVEPADDGSVELSPQEKAERVLHLGEV